MPAIATSPIIETLRQKARPLLGEASDYDPLLNLIGDAHFVLLGEATHGTHEFYRARSEITRRLIMEKGFIGMAVEADWPDAYRVNRFIQHVGKDSEAIQALAGFKRFPTWMWRNADILDLLGWLREHNDHFPKNLPKFGFYGLDLYSLFGSIEAVLKYLEKVDMAAAERARYRYSCFDHFGEDTQAYGYAAGFGITKSCEREAAVELEELRQRAAEYARRDGQIAADEFFFAEQNARLVCNAEEYYRTMFHGQVESWNLRDRHMAETFEALVAHLEKQISHPKLVVWAHNSHLGDARATAMGARGELNLGQLLREKHGDDAVLVGFTTYAGTVTAASDWDAPANRKRVRPALKNSYEALFHDAGRPRFILALRGDRELAEQLGTPGRLERAIGVVYRPQTERLSHYFSATLASQFDAVLHFDETRAVEPLEVTAEWEKGEEPETFPFGL
ncbi:MAG: hypothetical protein JWR26_2592 [Pedosphaera sp.]|nr:hypothetical protein [Pedosphaera sp.]